MFHTQAMRAGSDDGCRLRDPGELMDDEQKRPIEANDLNSSLARAADPAVHMEIVLFGSAKNARGNVRPPVAAERSRKQTTPVVPVPPTALASEDELLRDELLGNDSLGG